MAPCRYGSGMLTYPRLPSRLIACGAALALALGASACGGSDDESNGGSENASTAPTTTDGKPQTETQLARATIDRLYKGHRDSDPSAVCAELSAPAQEQIIQGELGGEDVSCEESFEKFFEGSEGSEQKRTTLTAKVGKVRVNGKRAVASVEFRTGSGKIPLVKVDGEWKLDAVGAAQPAP